MNAHKEEPAIQHDILVVDDIIESLQLLTSLLTEHGYRVRPASSGKLALRSVAAKKPDLILLDARMPEMDGFEVCRLLKGDEQTRDIPVIFVTALNESADKVRAFEEGAIDYITKPYLVEEVLARIRNHVRLRALTGHLEWMVKERTGELSVANLQLRQALEEKSILLKEVHHRVKNNMQVIHSLLNLQASTIPDAKVRALFEESMNRIRSMSLVHEKLYRSADLAHVDFKEYVQSLVSVLSQSLGRSGVTFLVEMESIAIDLNAGIPCGLILNELISNSMKHAFPDDRKGTIRVGITRTVECNNVLFVSDDGIGFPADVDFRNPPSLGLQLVNVLAGQIHGKLSLTSGPGATFRIVFPTGLKGN